MMFTNNPDYMSANIIFNVFFENRATIFNNQNCL